MKQKKELLPAQRRFLEYILAWGTINDSLTEGYRIHDVLKIGEYLSGGMHEKYFNWLRKNYISEYYEFESSYTPVIPGRIGGDGFDGIQSEFNDELNKAIYEEITK